MEPSFNKLELIREELHSTKFNISPMNNTKDNSEINFIIKDHRDILISKRKEFIQNYRKKQRLLLSLMDSNSNNKKKLNNNIDAYEMSIEKIKNIIDPVSRIICLKNYIFSDNSKIDINFMKNNNNFIKEIFKDFKKYLFDYENKNISRQIKINNYIIYCILSFLFEPEINPIFDEFDYEFLSNINTFCFYYLKMTNDYNIKENIILYLYILFLLNNLVSIYPDAEILKATIDIKNIIQLFYNKFFSFVKNNKNISTNFIVNYNELSKFELLEFTFFKLIENCLKYLHLKEHDIKELLNILLSLLYYNYSKNDIKLFIYSLECLTSTNNSYYLFEDDYYNNFLIRAINNIKNNFSNEHNININRDLLYLKFKLILELYLERLLIFLNYNYNNSNKKIMTNIDLFFKEEIIVFLKNYLYYFYNNFISQNYNKEIKKYEMKIVIKILKILCILFDLLVKDNNKTNNFIYLSIKNKIEKLLCSLFIIKDQQIHLSLYEVLINTFTYFIKLEDKYSNKICNFIINIFINIYSQTNFDLSKKDNYLFEIQKFLIDKKINIHLKILSFLNEEKYPFLVQNMLRFINKILSFCEQKDIYENRKNCLYNIIRKDIFDLNVFDEIENIEFNSEDINLKIFAEYINNNYFRDEEKIEQS